MSSSLRTAEAFRSSAAGRVVVVACSGRSRPRAGPAATPPTADRNEALARPAGRFSLRAPRPVHPSRTRGDVLAGGEEGVRDLVPYPVQGMPDGRPAPCQFILAVEGLLPLGHGLQVALAPCKRSAAAAWRGGGAVLSAVLLSQPPCCSPAPAITPPFPRHSAVRSLSHDSTPSVM